MPTRNKRINLTVPEVLYEKIAAFRDENGISSDASACIQLISAQLKSLENTKAMLQAMQMLTPEQFDRMSKEGISALRNEGFLPKAD